MKFKIPIDAEMPVSQKYINDIKLWHHDFKRSARKEGSQIAMVRLGMTIASSAGSAIDQYHLRSRAILDSVKVGYKATRRNGKIKIVGQITFEI